MVPKRILKGCESRREEGNDGQLVCPFARCSSLPLDLSLNGDSRHSTPSKRRNDSASDVDERFEIVETEEGGAHLACWTLDERVDLHASPGCGLRSGLEFLQDGESGERRKKRED